jgi:hypothetical protein
MEICGFGAKAWSRIRLCGRPSLSEGEKYRQTLHTFSDHHQKLILQHTEALRNDLPDPDQAEHDAATVSSQPSIPWPLPPAGTRRQHDAHTTSAHATHVLRWQMSTDARRIWNWHFFVVQEKKIRVFVRKRPLQTTAGAVGVEGDVITVWRSRLFLHEPRRKLDM